MGTQWLQLSQEDLSREQLWPRLRLLSSTRGPQPAPSAHQTTAVALWTLLRTLWADYNPPHSVREVQLGWANPPYLDTRTLRSSWEEMSPRPQRKCPQTSSVCSRDSGLLQGALPGYSPALSLLLEPPWLLFCLLTTWLSSDLCKPDKQGP